MPNRSLLCASSLCLALALLAPAAASADTICVAVNKTAMMRPLGPGEQPEAVGSLDSHQCFTVQARGPQRTRIWVNLERGFKGEVEVLNSVLAQVLIDDVELRQNPDEQPWGMALAGMGVVLDRALGGGMMAVKSLDGRARVSFVVSEEDTLIASSWPAADPEEELPEGWPSAETQLPPSPSMVFGDPTSGDLRVQMGRPLFFVEDILRDPHLGELRYTPTEGEEGDFATKVQVVGRNFWAEGFVAEKPWREGPPPQGWGPLDGAPQPAQIRWPPREIGDKGAKIATTAKGSVFGELNPGTRLRVLAEEKGWMQVEAAFPGGTVQGWVEKKRVLKEGKEAALPLFVKRMAGIHVDTVEARWWAPWDHFTEESQQAFDALREEAEEQRKAKEAEAKERGDEPPTPVPDMDEASLSEEELEAKQKAARDAHESRAKTLSELYEIEDTDFDLIPIYASLVGRMDKMRFFYAQHLVDQPNAAGKITVRFLIEASGEVSGLELQEVEVDDQRLKDAILKIAERFHFEERDVPRTRRGQEPRDYRLEVLARYAFSPIVQ